MNCTIINPPPVGGYYLNREPICVGVSPALRNPLLLYSLSETLKKWTDLENVTPLDMNIQKVNIESFKDSDYVILINSILDYKYNREWSERFLSKFSGEKIVIITPNVLVDHYLYKNAMTIGGLFPEQEILKLFSDEKISYDEIPIPTYDRSVYKKVWIESGRGCPYSCLFCGQSRTNLMQKSPEKLFEEIKLIDKQGVRFASLLENVFTINKKRVLKLCELLHNSDIRIKLECQTRVDLVDEDLLKRMFKAGFRHIIYGIESVNPETQKAIRKNLDLDKAKEVIRLTKKYLMVTLYFIAGLPEETEKTILEQLIFIKEVKPDYVCVFPIYCDPGTEWYDHCFKSLWLRSGGLEVGERYEQFVDEDCIVSYPHLSSKKILELTYLLRDQVQGVLGADIVRFFRRIKWRFIYNNSEKSRIEILKNKFSFMNSK